MCCVWYVYHLCCDWPIMSHVLPDSLTTRDGIRLMPWTPTERRPSWLRSGVPTGEFLTWVAQQTLWDWRLTSPLRRPFPTEPYALSRVLADVSADPRWWLVSLLVDCPTHPGGREEPPPASSRRYEMKKTKDVKAKKIGLLRKKMFSLSANSPDPVCPCSHYAPCGIHPQTVHLYFTISTPCPLPSARTRPYPLPGWPFVWCGTSDPPSTIFTSVWAVKSLYNK